MSRKDLPYRAIFGAPLAIAVLGLVGLVGALLDDGAWAALGPARRGAGAGAGAGALAPRRR